jgi:hypothetical protein
MSTPPVDMTSCWPAVWTVCSISDIQGNEARGPLGAEDRGFRFRFRNARHANNKLPWCLSYGVVDKRVEGWKTVSDGKEHGF